MRDKIPAFIELTFQWNEIEHQYIKEDIYNISSSVCRGEKKAKQGRKVAGLALSEVGINLNGPECL